MAVWKRYKGKKVVRGHKDYDRATWIAEGKVDGSRYKIPLPKETIKTLEQARGEDERIRSRIRAGDGFIADRTQFSTFVDEVFLPYWKVNRQSYTVVENICKGLKRFFKNDHIRKINQTRCEEFKRWRMSQPVRCQKCRNNIEHDCQPSTVSNGTVNGDLTILKSVFRLAQTDKKLRDNPMEHVPLLEMPDERDRVLLPHERESLWPVIQAKTQLYSFVVVALLTGWRKQQILHLKVSDLEDGRVWIMKQKRRPRRLIRVHPLVWNILTMLAEVREEWLFINPSGERLKEIHRPWQRACKKAGIEGLRIHDLRHSFSTEMLESGAGEFVISDALNHASIKTTKRYAHVRDELLSRSLEGLRTDDIPLPNTIQTPSDRIM